MKKEKKKKRHTVRKIVFGVLLIGLGGIFFVGSKVFGLDAWHEFSPEKILGADESLVIYDCNEKEISTLYLKQNRISVSLSEVPDKVQKAFIAAEDVRFYDHKGIDLIRIAGAAVQDIKSGGYVQGASTITQQLIKLSHLSTEKTMERKAEEAVLAYLMEKQFSKNEILEMYINYVYFGGGFYGIQAASRGYFGVDVSELSAAQGAVLAGILKSPTAYAPHIDYDASMKRHETILRLMNENGYLTQEEYAQALDEKIELHMESSVHRSYYIDYAMQQAADILDISIDELLTGGYRIYTAQDSEIQSLCDEIYAADDNFPDSDVQSAIVVSDTDNGYIRAMIGGRGEYEAFSYNRAVEIRRQPGSVIKPIIVYAPAIEYYGYTAATVIRDEPTSFDGYTPKNSGNKYYGNVTLRKAISSSLNIPAVTVLNDIGVESGKGFAKRLGIEFDEKDTSLSLALGGFTYGVSPLQVANAYAALGDGMYKNTSAIISIKDKTGKLLYSNSVKKQRVLSADNAYILTNMLCSVAETGTGHRLSELNFDIACKTGTVSESDTKNRDAWIAAYTTEYSVAVWIGYDSAKDGSMGANVTGGTYPALIVRSLFEQMYKDKNPVFEKPENIIKVRLDSRSAEQDCVSALATPLTPYESSYYEYFVSGTEPTESSDYWNIPIAPSDFTCVSCNKEQVVFSFTVQNKNVIYSLYRRVGDKEMLLGEYMGEEGQLIMCADNSPANAKHVEYFIRPFHAELQISGERVVGADSVAIKIKFE